MFDFHMHSSVSHDSDTLAADMLSAAEKNGLREICFTDHYDLHDYPDGKPFIFTLDDYSSAYDSLASRTVNIRRGVEMGLTLWNAPNIDDFLSKRNFDFVIGSIHYADGTDPYSAPYWKNRSVKESFRSYLERTLKCVEIHSNFDVLGHLTYVCKSPNSPTHEPLLYSDFSDIVDEILKKLVSKGKGLEINTSGLVSVGELLPSKEFVNRYKDFGGEIITIGSDAHSPDRVGQNVDKALALAKDVFGYVCTYNERRPVFHKL